jgi:hypothetical protein
MRLSHFRAAFLALLLAFSFGASAQDLRNFKDLEKRLRLNPMQKEQFEIASGASQRAILSIGLVAMQLKARLFTELAKDRPDMDAVFRDHEEYLELVRPNFREARTEWAKLYAMLDDEQVAIARAYVEKQFANLDRIGDELLRSLRDKLRP